MNHVPVCVSCSWLLQSLVIDHLMVLELSRGTGYKHPMHLRSTYVMNPRCYGCLRVWAVKVEADLLGVLAKLGCIHSSIDANMLQSHLLSLGDLLVDKRMIEEISETK